jgi:Mn2+/Fe2+ NRAMP family transporter
LTNQSRKSDSWYSKVILGIIVAATGVGAGDLITASLAGSELGTAILWAAVVGSILKWVLNESLARWQMGTKTTILEGWFQHLGKWVQWIFMVYFVLWSYFVGGALISACGIAGAGFLPIGDPQTSKIVWGIIHSVVGLVLVWLGGFKAFEYAMSFFIAIMFGAVLSTAILLGPDWGAVAKGLLMPSLPKKGMPWLIGVLGGVGGTVTLLSYSYWIREKKRAGWQGVRESRFDLGVGYAMTAFFGAAMIVIGSRVVVTGRGDTVALVLAAQLAKVLGPAGKWIFLAGFWGAVYSSLVGVWQGVPYIFADFLYLRRGIVLDQHPGKNILRTREYKFYLLGLTFIPMTLLWFNLKQVQLIYAVMGAFFMPFLALTLLILNNRAGLVGKRFKNSWVINLLLLITLLFFSYVGFNEIIQAFIK